MDDSPNRVPRWRSTVVGALACALAFAVAGLASPGGATALVAEVGGSVVSGRVTSEFSGAGLAGINVELCLPDGTASMETSTAATGAYAFTGVPSGEYRVGFWDPADRYEGEWWFDAWDPTDAEPVIVSAPLPRSSIDVSLWPYPTAWPSFSAVRLVLGSMTPTVGREVVLGVSLTDLFTGAAMGAPPALRGEWSRDLSTWTGVPASAIRLDEATGEYSMTVSVMTTEPVAFRFATVAQEFMPGEQSDTIVLRGVDYTSSWIGACFAGTTYTQAKMTLGYDLRMEGTLQRPAGLPTATVVLESSTDGLRWETVEGAAVVRSEFLFSRYTAITPVVTRRFYRLVDVTLPWRRVVSASILVLPQTWMSIAANVRSVRLPKPFVLSGTTSGRPGDGCVVEVRKPGSSRWSYSSKRLAYRFGGANAYWWYRYVPKRRGTYYFRARRIGDVYTSPVSSVVSVRVI